MATGKSRSVEDLATLDQTLDELGTREGFQAVAIKEVLAWQIEQAMKAEGLSRKGMAERMHTSRSQIARLLDRKSTRLNSSHANISYAVLGRKVRLDLV